MLSGKHGEAELPKTTGVFDIEDRGLIGVSIVPARNYLTNAAVSERELDAQMKLLRADLDATEKRARARIKANENRPLELG
jgi:hypothetical protein